MKVFPSDIIVARSFFRPNSNVLKFRSPFTQTADSIEYPGSHWVASLTMNTTVRAKGSPLEGFIHGLRGIEFFELWNHAHEIPAGTANGSPQVQGGGQTGITLVTDGWAPSETVLKAGDMFGLTTDWGLELFQVTEDAASNGSGQATLTFVNPLRGSPANGEPLVLDKPRAKFQLATPTSGTTQFQGNRNDITIDVQEYPY